MSIKQLESKEIGIKALREKLPEGCKVILYDSLRKDTRHRSEIFKNVSALVVLYEGKIDDVKQGHFVVLIPRPTHIEYFSSLGFSPNHETTILGLDNKVFKRILGKNFKYSRAKLQRNKYDVNTCGLWVLARCYLRNWNLQHFQSFFQKRHHISSPDDLVTLMTMMLQ